MKIHEFQAKRLLKAAGVRVPKGELASTPNKAREIGDRLRTQTGNDTWMVKAQIRAGGRGLGILADGKSGIRKATGLDELKDCADAMIGGSLVTDQTGAEGLPVKAVYVEQAMQIEREIGLSVLVDQQNRQVVALISEHGGVELEVAAHKYPDSIHKIIVGADKLVDKNQLARIYENLGLEEPQRLDLFKTVSDVVELFFSRDASLIEINPLGLCAGKWIALDAKMMFDSNALFRQQDIAAIEKRDGQEEHKQASFDGFNYLTMGGDIGCLVVGAGLSMATIDSISHIGGNPGNFLDLPPDSRVNRVVSALDLLLENPQLKCILVNVFGGGIMRCDTVSDAIMLVQNSRGIDLPLVVRLAGTNAELANRRLRESMPEVHLAKNLAEAAQQSVALAETAGPGLSDKESESILSRIKSVFR